MFWSYYFLMGIVTLFVAVYDAQDDEGVFDLLHLDLDEQRLAAAVIMGCLVMWPAVLFALIARRYQ